MKQKYKFILGVLGFVILLVFVSFFYQQLKDRTLENPSDSSTESSKNYAPTFSVYDADGNKVKLIDFDGKPIVVNFWASWCPPCKSEMPHFNEVYEDLGNEIVFMMVNMTDGTRETLSRAKEYLQSEYFSFPVYYDTKQDAASTYRVFSLPTTLFIDSEGYLVKTVQGAMTKKQLTQYISLIQQ